MVEKKQAQVISERNPIDSSSVALRKTPAYAMIRSVCKAMKASVELSAKL